MIIVIMYNDLLVNARYFFSFESVILFHRRRRRRHRHRRQCVISVRSKAELCRKNSVRNEWIGLCVVMSVRDRMSEHTRCVRA